MHREILQHNKQFILKVEKDFNQHFTKYDVWTAIRTTPFATRWSLSTTTVMYCFIPTRMAVIPKVTGSVGSNVKKMKPSCITMLIENYVPIKICSNFSWQNYHSFQRSKQSKCLSNGKWLNEVEYMHKMEYYSSIKRNTLLICYRIKHQKHCVKWKMPNLIDCLLQYCIYMKWSEQANL